MKENKNLKILINFFNQSKFREAEDSANSVELKKTLAYLYIQHKKIHDSIRIYKKIIHHTNDEQANFYLSICYANINENKKAEKILLNLLKKNPKEIRYLFSLAEINTKSTSSFLIIFLLFGTTTTSKLYIC